MVQNSMCWLPSCIVRALEEMIGFGVATVIVVHANIAYIENADIRCVASLYGLTRGIVYSSSGICHTDQKTSQSYKNGSIHTHSSTMI